MRAATSLYSPAATSDSSGFSERETSSHGNGFTPNGHPAGLFSLPSQQQQLRQQQQHPFSPPHYHNLPGGHAVDAGPLRAGSPSFFSYHNPTLTASPYSTLPRRLNNGAAANAPPTTQQTLHSPQLSRAFGRNSPQQPPALLELMSTSSPSSSSATPLASFSAAAGRPVVPPRSRNTALATASAASSSKITARTPLLEDDRESCV